MPSKILSASVIGLDGALVEVEADIANGLTSFAIVGLPDTAVQEARERVRAAIKNSGVDFPAGRVTVNLAPADLKKEGTAYDLPIAVAILTAAEEVRLSFGVAAGLEPETIPWRQMLFVGEVALDGGIRPATGVLPMALLAKQLQIPILFVPRVNAAEAALIEGLTIYPVENLKDIVEHLKGIKTIEPMTHIELSSETSTDGIINMAYIAGQDHAKRALEIAAAGGHNILLTGPPGSGKTLLARAMVGILPTMTFDESIEVTKIYSVAGLLPANKPIVTGRPFRAPHHTASAAAVIGGGTSPKPGEITLAHRGVLFLDEVVEFHRDVLESLREPLEGGSVVVSRAGGTARFPAKFILVAARNPCPCGYAGDPKHPCTCSAGQVIKYQKKISGPLLDRIDLVVEVPRLKFDKLTEEKVAEASEQIKQRVEAARQKQIQRFNGSTAKINSEIGVAEIKTVCQVDSDTQNLLRQAVDKMHLSTRAYHRTLKLARTIADLAGVENIAMGHVAEALQYRPKMEL